MNAHIRRVSTSAFFVCSTHSIIVANGLIQASSHQQMLKYISSSRERFFCIFWNFSDEGARREKTIPIFQFGVGETDMGRK